MANKNFLSSSVTIKDINKNNQEKKSIKDREISFVMAEKNTIDNSKVRVLDPDFVIKESKPKKKTHQTQGIITRTITKEKNTEVKEEKVKQEPVIKILTPNVEKKRTTKSQVRNNYSKFQTYGQERKTFDEFDLYQDDYEEEYTYYKKDDKKTKKATNALKVIFWVELEKLVKI